MEQQYGFEIDDRVCDLQKGLYGLKQALRQWNKEIVTFLLDHMFSQSSTDSCVFVYKHDDICIYLALCVDDGLIWGNNEKFIDKLLSDLNCNFEITYKVADTFVGLQIEREKDHNLLKIHQSFYANKVLEKFNHTTCSSVYIPADPGIKFVAANSKANEKVFPYREAIGSLMYLAVCTRPDLAYIVGVLSRYMENPDTTHWQGIKRVFKYLKGSIDRGIT